jgi:hypothetical protein
MFKKSGHMPQYCNERVAAAGLKQALTVHNSASLRSVLEQHHRTLQQQWCSSGNQLTCSTASWAVRHAS